jgi:two-component system, cell cycle sensor histidine kinase and response regulator CckA
MGQKPKTGRKTDLPTKNPDSPRAKAAHSSGGHGLGAATAVKPARETPTRAELTIDELRDAIENANDVIYTHDLAGDFFYTNAAAQRVFGYTKEETRRLNVRDLLDTDQLALAKDSTQAKLTGHSTPNPYLMTVNAKDGSKVTLELNTRLIYKDGVPVGVQGIGRDITLRRRAEQALAQSEQLFRTVIESCSDVICILSTKGQIEYPSPAIEEKLGYAAAEIVGKSAFDFAHPDDRQFMITRFKGRFGREASSPPVELRLRHKNGTWIPFEAVSNLIHHDGQISGVVVSCRDVSDRKRSEDELRISEERYRQLFQRNLAGVFVSTVEGKMLDCNDSFAQIFGYESREHIMNNPARSLYQKETDRPDFIARLRNAKSLTNAELHMQRCDGRAVWVLENVALIPGSERLPETIQGTLIDITERKEAEEAVFETQNKFRAVAETASSAIYIHNNSRFLYVNQASESISGYSAAELLEMNPFDLVHPADHDLVRTRALQRVTGSAEHDRYEYRIRHKNGSIRWLDFSASTVQFGGEAAILGTAFDITERKRVEQMQRALYRIADRANAAEDLNEFFASVHNIVAELIDAKNFFISLFDQKTGMLSYPYFVDELDPAPQGWFPPQRGLTEYVLRMDRPVLVQADLMRELQESGEVNLIGSMFVDWMGAPLRSGTNILGILVAQSYTEAVRYSETDLEMLNFVSQHVASAILRKRNQDALRVSELRNRSLVQSAVYGIYRSNKEGNFLEVNPAMVNMLGYASAEEVLALSMARDVYTEHSERDRLIREHPKQARVENVEVKWKRKDGKPITVRLSGRAMENETGEVEGFEMIAEDVTERRALEEQLRQSQKMEAVGRLAGGVAHDFNNLLTVIRGYSELMLEEFAASDPLRDEVEEIKKAADRASGLTRQLLAFSRQQVLAPKVLDLNIVVSNMERLLKRLLGENIRLGSVLASELGRVKADPGQIEQVIMNLAVNARDAMPKGGRLTIETANADLDESYTHEHVGARPGKYVMLAVSDTGSGMTPEIRQRVFEPFFTTKELGKGTGLGLSTVYGIVKQSEGYVWVYSEPTRGTSFKVYLPRVDAPADARPAPLPEKTRYRGTETVLLVEDEDGVRALVKQVLTRNGYTVLEARHGGEALLHCERRSEEIHLLVTDVVLEQMSGTELSSRLASLRPGMKVLYISGYTDDAIVHHGVTQGTHFLQKPFTTEALARKIRQVLDESKPN